MELITEAGDERIADYRALTDVELRTRWEPPHGLFIAEGELVLRRALRAGYQPRSFLVEAKRAEQVADLVGAPVYGADPEVLEQVTGFHVHRGVLASFHRRPLPPASEVLAQARRVVILEDVNNHTNLGAIFRGVAALGVDAVLLSPTCADPLYRRSVRVSMGEVFAIPYAKLEPWPDALSQVRDAGYTIMAMTPAEDAVPMQRLTAEQRVRPALLLGAEGPGLSRKALAASDLRVKLPMRRGVDSLNVAAATAVACWELSREDDELEAQGAGAHAMSGGAYEGRHEAGAEEAAGRHGVVAEDAVADARDAAARAAWRLPDEGRGEPAAQAAAVRWSGPGRERELLLGGEDRG